MTTLNDRHPGRENYSGPREDIFAGWAHHTVLAEVWRGDIMDRVKQLSRKPSNEVAVRLHCLTRLEILGMPWEQAYAAWQQAYAALEQADAARGQTYAARGQAYAAWQQADAAWQQAYAAWQQAYAAWEQAYAAWQQALVDHAAELEAEVQRWVPDAPWDGQRLVFPAPTTGLGT